MRGRKPKPFEVQRAEGDPSKRGVHRLDQKLEAQPRAARGLPSPPEYLTEEAREAWAFWKEELESMGLDCRPDAITLEATCIAYQLVRRTYAAQDGRALDKALKTLRSLTSEFGLSPVSRTRLTIDKKDDGEADMMKELSKPRATKKEAVQ